VDPRNKSEGKRPATRVAEGMTLGWEQDNGRAIVIPAERSAERESSGKCSALRVWLDSRFR